MAKGPWNTGTWDDAQWDSLPVTSVTATGGVGDLGTQQSVTLSGNSADGATGAVGLQGQVALTGVEATGATGTLTASVTPIVILDDSHEGDKTRKKRWEAEQERRERRKQELIAVYEQLHESRPEIAERIVEPHLTVNIAQPSINWDALLTDIDRVERLMREHQEMDDEEVLLLL